MKQREKKEVKCKKCGGAGKIFGSDHTNTFGPFGVACISCGAETVVWAYAREAWKAWKLMNDGNKAEAVGRSALFTCYLNF